MNGYEIHTEFVSVNAAGGYAIRRWLVIAPDDERAKSLVGGQYPTIIASGAGVLKRARAAGLRDGEAKPID